MLHLDPGNPEFAGVLPSAARLFEVDLTHNEIVRTIHFDESIAPPDSYLNNVRVDTITNTAFITDSNLGALVVVDLESGNVRRLLTPHPSTKVEDIKVVVQDIPFEWAVHSDGIALDASGGWLYCQALTGRTLYRVPTSALRDTSLTEEWKVINQPDVLMIPIGGEAVHNTMDEDEALEAVRIMKPAMALPCHYNCPAFFTKKYNPARFAQQQRAASRLMR